MMKPSSKIYIAGHRGMVGSAICRLLEKNGFQNILTRTSSELDLRNQTRVNAFFETEKPEFVFLAAGKVGGIHANDTYRADFLYDNLMIEANVIHAAYINNVEKMVFLGSSCIYPKMAPQPLKEDHLLTGTLEPTNEPYAIAKIAGIKMCESYRDQHGCNFISVTPTNLYGIGDNYNLKSAHVLPALIRKFHEAKQNGKPSVEVWGTGKPKREFLFADEVADACIFLMQNYDGRELVNIGAGEDVSIKELVELIQGIIGFQGEVIWNTKMPDGTPRKWMDVSKLTQLGWKRSIELRRGIEMTYADFLKQQEYYSV